MPAPVLIGIPALISSIVTWVTSMATALVAWIAQRGTINTLHVVASLAVLATLVATLDTLINTASAYVDSYAWGPLVTSVLPDSLALAIGVSLSADIARWIHDISQAQLAKKFQ